MRSDSEPPGQKDSFIRETRRKQILQGAIETLAAVGYANASLARIAADLGISKGVISYHFRNKETLMTSVVEHAYQDIFETIVPNILAAESVIEAIRTHIREVARYALEHRSTMVALSEVIGNLRRPDGRLHYGAESNEVLYPGLEEMYRSGRAAGELREFDDRVMAITQQAAVDAMFAYWQTHPEHDLIRHAEELGDLIVRAVAATPTEPPSPPRGSRKKRTR
ncbi:MAG TPA: TetR/AcrR family transcriptional regulator [Microlunatus sp.]|nr:TetR/AcrR family transcriptional regulator [Microlunatus sp.]